ncbi:RHS domain-containing protein, partial [Escherichia coli]|uniref:RHS domain-containing protein n=1 Tax=Escherichia coli TaxID=562 RepID=UPI0010CB1A47
PPPPPPPPSSPPPGAPAPARAVVFPAHLVGWRDRLGGDTPAPRVSSESRRWLAQCGLPLEQLEKQVEPEYTPARKVHLYHCDHRGLPLALISEDGNTAWSGEYD